LRQDGDIGRKVSHLAGKKVISINPDERRKKQYFLLTNISQTKKLKSGNKE
jgi:hypothetical protein